MVPHEEAPLALVDSGPSAFAVPTECAGPRPHSALFAFDPRAGTASEPYHGIRIRKALKTLWDSTPPLEDALWSITDLVETKLDMARSLTCLTPPGIVAHTSRFYRAIRRGCIPVTFFRANRLPFDDVLDYDAATLNLEPSDVNSTINALDELLRDPDRLAAKRHALGRLQRWFDWEAAEDEVGVAALLLRALEKRAIAVSRLPTHRA